MKHPHACGAPKWGRNENDYRMPQPETNKIPNQLFSQIYALTPNPPTLNRMP